MTIDALCPYYTGHANSLILCCCGLEKDKFKGDTVIHISKHCNNKYTQCSTYQGLRRRLQS